MKEVIERILRAQFDFSMIPKGGLTAEGLAQTIADAVLAKDLAYLTRRVVRFGDNATVSVGLGGNNQY